MSMFFFIYVSTSLNFKKHRHIKIELKGKMKSHFFKQIIISKDDVDKFEEKELKKREKL